MKTKTLRLRKTRSVDLTAIKYIRIVIASYIMAVGMGIISGFDTSAYFSSFLTHPWTLYASQVFVVFCALMLMLGFFVRLVALSLTIVILASSIQVNLMVPVQGSLDAFWADLVLVCSLLACYWPLTAGQLRKQAIVRSTPSAIVVHKGGIEKVVPRRVTLPNRSGPATPRLALRGKKTATPGPKDALAARLSRLMVDQDAELDDTQNIFA